MFNPGVMTEEAGTDIRASLRTIDDLGLKQLEVSSFGAKKVSDLTAREVEELKAGLDDREVEVSCVSPTIFFNLPLHAEPDERSYWGSYMEHMEALRRSIDIAHRLGTRIVRVFGFKTETMLDPPLTGDHWPLLVSKFREAAELAAREDVLLAVETCFFNNISNCTTARRLIDDVGSPNLKALWDICNCLYYGETVFPDGYQLIRDDIVHIHLKDGHPDPVGMSFHMCPLGEGDVRKYPQIFAALEKDSYQGGMSLECEFVPNGGTLVDALRESLAGFRRITA